MTVRSSTALAISLAVSLAALLDYFLFSTGNASLTYAWLGGRFELPIVLLAAVSIAYGTRGWKRREDRANFVAYTVVLCATGAVLYAASDRARQFAGERIDAQARTFMQNPQSTAFVAAPETRTLMAQATSRQYSVEREAFIPTFRRADYLVRDGSGRRFRVVLSANGAGSPEVSMRALD